MVTENTDRNRLIGSIVGAIIAFVLTMRLAGWSQWDDFDTGGWIAYIPIQVVCTWLGWALGGLMGEDWDDDGPICGP